MSNEIIGAAIEVHKQLGPGLLESTYQHCLAHEFTLRHIYFEIEYPLPVEYKGVLKSVEQIKGIHEAQLLTYMKLADIKQGFLINFNIKLLKQGLKSFVL